MLSKNLKVWLSLKKSNYWTNLGLQQCKQSRGEGNEVIFSSDDLVFKIYTNWLLEAHLGELSPLVCVSWNANYLLSEIDLQLFWTSSAWTPTLTSWGVVFRAQARISAVSSSNCKSPEDLYMFCNSNQYNCSHLYKRVNKLFTLCKSAVKAVILMATFCIGLYVQMQVAWCLKITEKSLIQHGERSELRLHFEWTKVNWKCLNSVTRPVILNRTKIGGKCLTSNAIFWVIFKQYEKS